MVWVVAAVYLGLAETLAARALVLTGSKVLDSFARARKLIRAHFVQVILSYLVSYLVIMLVGLLVLLVVLFFISIFGLMGYVVYLLSSIVGVIYIISALLILTLISIVVSAIITGFVSTYWTLVYRELKKIKA